MVILCTETNDNNLLNRYKLASTATALTSLDLSSGWQDAAPLSAVALLQLTKGCPHIGTFRAAYTTVSCEFITAVGEQWGSGSSGGSGLTHLDLSFCKSMAEARPLPPDSLERHISFCEALAQTLERCGQLTTLALAGFAAMVPAGIGGETDGSPPSDVVIEAILTHCRQLTDLNCSETDIGEIAFVTGLLTQHHQRQESSAGGSGAIPLRVVDLSGCRCAKRWILCY